MNLRAITIGLVGCMALATACHTTPSPVFVGFDTGVDEPRNKEDDSVRDAVQDMKDDRELHVVVIGHADATGSPVLNKELSFRRARNIRRKLVAAGIDGHRVKVAARGANDPMASNDTASGRAENRRTELFFFYPKNGDAHAQVSFDIEVHDE